MRLKMDIQLRKFLKKAVVLSVASAAYAVWLWKDLALGTVLLSSNVLSVVGMSFFVWGLIGLVHNMHALAALTYSLRYVMHMVRNVRNKDAATGKEVISYVDYVASIEKRENIPWCFLAAAGFTALSVVLWLLR